MESSTSLVRTLLLVLIMIVTCRVGSRERSSNFDESTGETIVRWFQETEKGDNNGSGDHRRSKTTPSVTSSWSQLVLD